MFYATMSVKLAKSFHFTRMDSLCFSSYRDSNKMYFGQTNAICSKQNVFPAFVNYLVTIAINSKNISAKNIGLKPFIICLETRNKEHSVGYKPL